MSVSAKRKSAKISNLKKKLEPNVINSFISSIADYLSGIGECSFELIDTKTCHFNIQSNLTILVKDFLMKHLDKDFDLILETLALTDPKQHETLSNIIMEIAKNMFPISVYTLHEETFKIFFFTDVSEYISMIQEALRKDMLYPIPTPFSQQYTTIKHYI